MKAPWRTNGLVGDSGMVCLPLEKRDGSRGGVSRWAHPSQLLAGFHQVPHVAAVSSLFDEQNSTFETRKPCAGSCSPDDPLENNINGLLTREMCAQCFWNLLSKFGDSPIPSQAHSKSVLPIRCVHPHQIQCNPATIGTFSCSNDCQNVESKQQRFCLSYHIT